MRRLYTFLLYLLIPYLFLRLYWKSRRNPAYRARISERFLIKKPKMSVDIWLHAVSLGEVVAATPLIEQLLDKKYRLMVTTMTPTGSHQVQQKWGDRVLHQYVPYDLPWCVKRFLKSINARTGIIMETEMWPNLIHYANKSGVHLALVNARISDKAFQQYQKARFFFAPLLQQFSFIGAQSELDAERYRALGAPPEAVIMLGNMKFDLSLTTSTKEGFAPFKIQWGSDRPVLIAASTHDDEEKQWLNQLKRLQQKIPDVVLLIAPRRPERFQDVWQLCQHLGFHTARRSEIGSITTSTEVVVLDSMGELLSFYQLSDYAFVGGSLVPVGGHNVLEPIAVGVPVFCGPFMQNSKSICNDLKQANAIQWAENIDDLIVRLIYTHEHPEQRNAQVRHASAVLKANQGAVKRYVEQIEQRCF